MAGCGRPLLVRQPEGLENIVNFIVLSITAALASKAVENLPLGLSPAALELRLVL